MSRNVTHSIMTRFTLAAWAVALTMVFCAATTAQAACTRQEREEVLALAIVAAANLVSEGYSAFYDRGGCVRTNVWRGNTVYHPGNRSFRAVGMASSYASDLDMRVKENRRVIDRDYSAGRLAEVGYYTRRGTSLRIEVIPRSRYVDAQVGIMIGQRRR